MEEDYDEIEQLLAEELPGEKQYHQAIAYFLKNDVKAAKKCFREAAREDFHAADIWLYSMDAENEKKKEKALSAYGWLLAEDAKDTEDKKRAWVQNDLGFCCQLGLGCEKDLAEAIKYYEKAEAAEKDYLPALINLSICYSQAGPAKNLKKTFDYAKRAADLGDAESQYYVAGCFEAGRIIDPNLPDLSPQQVAAQTKSQEIINQNLRIAHHYYQLAAEQYYAPAQYQLGLWYEQGNQVVASNPVQAKNYFLSAARQGHPEAGEKLLSIMTDEADKAYERNFFLLLDSLKTPLDLNLTAEKKAGDLERQAKYWRDLPMSDTEEQEKMVKGFEADAAELRKVAKEPFIGVLATIKVCEDRYTFKSRFEEINGTPRDLETLEENLLAGLCYSRGISGCGKNNNRANRYYREALKQAKKTDYSSDYLKRVNLLHKVPNPYAPVANVLLSELLSDYREIGKTDRKDFYFEASKDALDDKQAELGRVIPELSQSLADYLEVQNKTNEDAFKTALKKAKDNDLLGGEITGWQIAFNVAIGFTGIGLLAILIYRYFAGHWGFRPWNNDFADKLEGLEQAVEQIDLESIPTPVKIVPIERSETEETDSILLSLSEDVELPLYNPPPLGDVQHVQSPAPALRESADPYHGVLPPLDYPPPLGSEQAQAPGSTQPSLSNEEAQQRSFKSDNLFPPPPSDNPPPRDLSKAPENEKGSKNAVSESSPRPLPQSPGKQN